ncbi:MAG: transposase, partial [Synergistaceae bacterium]|nr:transposase [Synergistaceae bacterium]
LISKAKSGSYQFNQISLPHYLDKEGYFSLIIPPEISVNLDYDKYLAVDLGLDNLASCVTSEGASFIGKQIKFYNRLYNKENAKLQSILAKQQIKYFSKRQYLNLQKRNARINYAMSVAARKIISYCIDNHIGNIVVGYNPYWKRNINIGSHNNQNFVQIPHGLMREKLNYLCELYGIKYYEQEESYTSKASFFDNDKLPVYNADNPQSYTFSGKRITRGQYMTSTCYILNADINGALNILRKCNLISLKALQDRGCVNHPQRIRVF